MPYDEATATLLRASLGRVLAGDPVDVLEKKMFGGIAMMVGGHMCVGVIDTKVVARVGPDQVQDAMGEADIGPMDFTGRPMKGWLYLHPRLVAEEGSERLDKWVGRARCFVASLGPPKPKKPRKRKTRRGT